MTLVGFTSQQVTVAVCGNLAKRGSSDCNMPQSQSERIRANEDVTLTQLFVQPPPVPCPCIVRATGTNGEFAIAPIDLVGHPIEAIVSPDDGPLVEVGLAVERRSEGFSGSVRAGLGAATTYAVTVDRAQHHHRAAHERRAPGQRRPPVERRRGADAVRSTRPRSSPGQTWTQTDRRRAARAPHRPVHVDRGRHAAPARRSTRPPARTPCRSCCSCSVGILRARPARARRAFDPAASPAPRAAAAARPVARRVRRRAGADVRRRARTGRSELMPTRVVARDGLAVARPDRCR